MNEIREIIGNTTATPVPKSDWAQTDSTKPDYIKNKPEVLTEDDVIYLIGNNGGGGGKPQVQSDWNQTDDTQVDYIKNKPVTGEVVSATIENGVLVVKQDPGAIAKGDSYILTEEDKDTIVADILSQLPIAEEMSV